MSTDASSLTTEDLEFLQRPLHGLLFVAAGPIPAQPRPVWFEATADGTVQLFTRPGHAQGAAPAPRSPRLDRRRGPGG